MSILISALYICVAFLSIYAWKDWFKSLCGLIFLMTFIAHPYFPERFANIQGLNIWNIVFADAFLAWLVSRRHQELFWNMPTIINVFLMLWLGVIVVGWIVMIIDRRFLHYTFVDIVNE